MHPKTCRLSQKSPLSKVWCFLTTSFQSLGLCFWIPQDQTVYHLNTHMHACAHVHTHTPDFFMTWRKDNLVEIRDPCRQLESVCIVYCYCWVTSVVSDSVRPHRRQPTRLPHPWDSPGKDTGVGCRFLLQCMKVKSEREIAQSCLTLATPWTAAYQAPQSMGFSRQKYWSGVPLPWLGGSNFFFSI